MVTSFDHTTGVRIRTRGISSPGNVATFMALLLVFDYLATCSPFAATETVVINKRAPSGQRDFSRTYRVDLQ